MTLEDKFVAIEYVEGEGSTRPQADSFLIDNDLPLARLFASSHKTKGVFRLNVQPHSMRLNAQWNLLFSIVRDVFDVFMHERRILRQCNRFELTCEPLWIEWASEGDQLSVAQLLDLGETGAASCYPEPRLF